MVIRTVAMVAGIIGGVYGLIVGLLGAYIIGWFLSSTSLIYSGLGLLLALAPPITGLVGAGIVRKEPLMGSGLMAVAGVMSFAGSFLAGSFFGPPSSQVLVLPASLFLVAAILGVIGKFLS
jgi:vacuolar-type H+-ATPase subunit I/STV1